MGGIGGGMRGGRGGGRQGGEYIRRGFWEGIFGNGRWLCVVREMMTTWFGSFCSVDWVYFEIAT